MPELICPVCGQLLRGEPKLYRCGGGHCYDRAKSGYVNLLPPTSGAKRHGDDKMMVKARADFLDKGYYDPLSRAVAECLAAHTEGHVELVDAGCGEGKYTVDAMEHLKKLGRSVSAVGLDISREALIQGAKRSRELSLCVASAAHMPLADGCADGLFNIFSPLMAGEFARVLRPDGVLIRVVPLEGHLWELKELIYDTPYPNPPADPEVPGFTVAERRDLCYSFTLSGGADIDNLFKMTPYYYKTSAADQAKAAAAQSLTVTAEFGIFVHRKAVEP